MEKDKEHILNKECYVFEDLVLITKYLRSPNGCPWDIEQTHESIRKGIIEETYEVCDAIDRNDIVALREELGDVLLQVVFHAQIEEENGTFNIDDVCDEICKKLIIRHPHVFGDIKAESTRDVLKNWDEIKNKTKGIENQSDFLLAVPNTLPSLMRAQKLQQRAARAGLGLDSVEDTITNLRKNIDKLTTATESNDSITDLIGDVLFSMVNLSRICGVDAEEVLYSSNNNFINLFRIMEKEGKLNNYLQDKPSVK